MCRSRSSGVRDHQVRGIIVGVVESVYGQHAFVDARLV